MEVPSGSTLNAGDHRTNTEHLATILLPSCYHLATILLPSCYHLSTILLPSCYHLATILLPSCSHLATILLPSCYHLATILLPSCYHLATILLPSCYPIRWQRTTQADIGWTGVAKIPKENSILHNWPLRAEMAVAAFRVRCIRPLCHLSRRHKGLLRPAVGPGSRRGSRARQGASGENYAGNAPGRAGVPERD